MRKRLLVAIDARMVEASGIGSYVRGLLSGLPEEAGGTDRFVAIGSPELLRSWSIPVISATAPIYGLREQWQVARAFARSRAPLLFVPHYNVPVRAVTRSLVTVHDLIHLKFPQFLPSRLALTYARFLLGEVVPRARAILTVSENSKRDLVEMLGIPAAKITVTYSAAGEGFRPRTDDEVRPVLERWGLDPGYLLYVGNLKEFKNVPFLVDAYAELRGTTADLPPLVLVGRNFIPGFDARLRTAPGVIWLSAVRSEDLPFLYCGATAFLYPSLYEGFGLPPLEAMASGTPVICSNRGSLPEVVGEAVILFDPESRSELGAAVERILRDQGLRERLRGAGLDRAGIFNWKRTAGLTWRVMSELV